MLTIAHLITGLETGGAERMLARLVAASDPGRFASVVISLTGPGAIGPQIAAAGVPLYTLDIRRGLPDPRALARLGRVLRRHRADILQTWLYHADFLGLAAHLVGLAPHLVWNLRATESIGSAVVRRLLAWCSSIPDAVIVNSLAGQRFHERLGYHPRAWVCLPNGFDTAALRPDPAARARRRAALGLGDDAIAILLPARYHPVKDHANFLAAAAILAGRRPEARFFLVGAGTGPDNRELDAAVSSHRLGDRLTRLGERRDLDALYPAFDIVTLSSALGEGFPNVLGEAMCCGVPCVATDSGDAATVIGDTGAVVPPRDPAALAAGWDRLASLGGDARASLGDAARERVVRLFALPAVVARYEAVYDAIASHPRNLCRASIDLPPVSR
ncbi:MAG TPA: glycosyltransferase [Stellaceae bacterium]|nr:glycosyltransferase [Stellaceae bacterium]